jgi:N-acetylmuramoyl-L-alanine amidase
MMGLPLVPGVEGESVRDLQRRLARLGIDISSSEAGTYGSRTEAAVRHFQRQRGLLETGRCDEPTWAALVEAGYRLGDRLVYLRSPMVRGDDVADLQRQLGALGFDAGRVDGIFGPGTERALKDFQRNAGLTSDGVCGPDVLASFSRVSSKIDATSNVAGVRERERLRTAPRLMHGRRVVVGDAGGLDVLARALSRLLRDAGALVAVQHNPDPSAQATEANSFDADVYLGLAMTAETPVRVAYYATTGFESAGGRRLAEQLVDLLGRDESLEVEPARGMRLPVLRETRMPAVMVHLAPAERVVAGTAALAQTLCDGVVRWAEAPVEA